MFWRGLLKNVCLYYNTLFREHVETLNIVDRPHLVGHSVWLAADSKNSGNKPPLPKKKASKKKYVLAGVVPKNRTELREQTASLETGFCLMILCVLPTLYIMFVR